MRKYAVDLTTDAVLIVNDREVVLDTVTMSEDDRFVLLSGWFEDNGDPFDRQVDPDSTYKVKA